MAWACAAASRAVSRQPSLGEERRKFTETGSRVRRMYVSASTDVSLFLLKQSNKAVDLGGPGRKLGRPEGLYCCSSSTGKGRRNGVCWGGYSMTGKTIRGYDSRDRAAPSTVPPRDAASPHIIV